MILDKKEIDKIAELVRLELTEEEKEKFSGELSSILDYVKKLGGVDTENIEIRMNNLSNIFRDDKAEQCEISQKELLKNAPMTENGFLKVKSILD